ncbi:MAG: UPF0236 family protein [Planctomycetaceae bacterium]|nr:UPF0236 family protein [Planctomycetaceae bacterium]MCB9950049.1 UPF0236 family protein [Planctomycetaceae bacterium]
MLETSLNAEGCEVQKSSLSARAPNGAPSRTCCGVHKGHHGQRTRQVLTQAGEISVSRIYLKCVQCGMGGYPVDEHLGIEGRYSRQAQQLICLAGASWSYDISSTRLEEFCGLKVCDETIRHVSQEHGAQANKWLRSDPEAVKEFSEEQGNIEFTTDGTSVNTVGGWREMKVGIFSKRDSAETATPAEWDSRTLPAPKGRVAFAAIEQSEDFGRRWKSWRKRLGLVDTSAITVVADGAKWIWQKQRQHLPEADGVLDIYHALEHIAATGKVLHTDLQPATQWNEQVKEVLLHSGYRGVAEFVQRGFETLTDAHQSAVNALLDYLAPHGRHLNYRQRLAKGQCIGNGQIEGACKNLIGRRLKANAARWRVRRVNRMAGLCSIMYTNHWKTYWQST